MSEFIQDRKVQLAAATLAGLGALAAMEGTAEAATPAAREYHLVCEQWKANGTTAPDTAIYFANGTKIFSAPYHDAKHIDTVPADNTQVVFRGVHHKDAATGHTYVGFIEYPSKVTDCNTLVQQMRWIDKTANHPVKTAKLTDGPSVLDVKVTDKGKLTSPDTKSPIANWVRYMMS